MNAASECVAGEFVPEDQTCRGLTLVSLHRRGGRCSCWKCSKHVWTVPYERSHIHEKAPPQRPSAVSQSG